MATVKKVSAIKNTPKHLLGIQNLSVLEAKEILTEAKSFIKLKYYIDDVRNILIS